jgi:hypothetical protein
LPNLETLKVEDLVLKYKRPIVVDTNGCWNWLGSISSQGYGIFNHKLVFGVTYAEYVGPCPLDRVLCHKCNNKRCVNPNHLYIGTYTQNMIDSVFAGRGKVGREGYKMMYELHKSGKRQVDIAKELNVSRTLVSMFFKDKIMCFKPADFKGLRRL